MMELDASIKCPYLQKKGIRVVCNKPGDSLYYPSIVHVKQYCVTNDYKKCPVYMEIFTPK
jgi:hypothetical protein